MTPQPGLPELRRIRQLETALQVLLKYLKKQEQNEQLTRAIESAEELLQ